MIDCPQPGGTHARQGELAGINDFKVLSFLVIPPASASGCVEQLP